MSNDLNFRIHPAIGIARVGNSPDFYLGPETAAGDTSGPIAGGLPIKPDTENDTITSGDLRDANGAFKRQAARFKIYQYAASGNPETYPLGPAACLQEIKIGSTIGDKTVADIIWTVHLANKKAAGYIAEGAGGVNSFNGKLPALRNANYPTNNAGPDDPKRLRDLIIDPGPRCISGRKTAAVAFDKSTTAAYFDGNAVKQLPDYPKSFPDDAFLQLYTAQGNVDTLGELQTDENGRLIVAGGYGRTAAFNPTPTSAVPYDYPLNDAVDNDGWFDDAGDGPVTAVLVLNDGTKLPVQGSAWVCATDPGIAPQIKNVVSLWDDVYDSWVRKLRLVPALFDGNTYNTNYKPGFDNQISGVFEGAELQQWIGNLPGGDPHNSVGRITASTPPNKRFFNILRNPNDASQLDIYLSPDGYSPYMPLALGDTDASFLALTLTQYFFIQQWSGGFDHFNPQAPALGPGELLDQNTLLNCLGGRFSPGIDLTYIVRLPELYIQNWEDSGTGPFRINGAPLPYDQAKPGQAFLSEAYVPLHAGPGLEPGDILKLMAIPWHTDYNSCANHPPDPGPNGKTIYPSTPPPTSLPYSDYSYWSWPAQRPVAVYTKDNPNERWFSLRGPGTETTVATNVGRFQAYKDFLTQWQNIGVVLQASVVEGAQPGNRFLEAESKFPTGEAVPDWPEYLPTSTPK